MRHEKNLDIHCLTKVFEIAMPACVEAKMIYLLYIDVLSTSVFFFFVTERPWKFRPKIDDPFKSFTPKGGTKWARVSLSNIFEDPLFTVGTLKLWMLPYKLFILFFYLVRFSLELKECVLYNISRKLKSR